MKLLNLILTLIVLSALVGCADDDVYEAESVAEPPVEVVQECIHSYEARCRQGYCTYEVTTNCETGQTLRTEQIDPPPLGSPWTRHGL